VVVDVVVVDVKVVVVVVIDVVDEVEESVETVVVDVVVTDVEVDVVSEEEAVRLVVVDERNQSQAVKAPATRKNKPINNTFFRNSRIKYPPFFKTHHHYII